MRIRPRNYSTTCAPSGDSAKLCRLAHVQCVTFFTHAVAQQFCAEAVDESAHESHTRRRAPHTTHQHGDCPSRTLPNNVARNSPRSFFDYASKRCNSNTVNSTFEIVTRELRAKYIEGPAVEGHEDHSSDGPDQHHTPQIDQTRPAPHTAHHTPHTTRQRRDRPSRTLPNNVARNSPRSFFDYASKRCNSNTANSKFEIVSRELRATLIEQARRRPTARHGTRRQAGPAASRPSGTKTGSQSQKAP